MSLHFPPFHTCTWKVVLFSELTDEGGGSRSTVTSLRTQLFKGRASMVNLHSVSYPLHTTSCFCLHYSQTLSPRDWGSRRPGLVEACVCGKEGSWEEGLLRTCSWLFPQGLRLFWLMLPSCRWLGRSAEWTWRDVAAPGLAPSAKFVHPSVLRLESRPLEDVWPPSKGGLWCPR